MFVVYAKITNEDLDKNDEKMLFLGVFSAFRIAKQQIITIEKSNIAPIREAGYNEKNVHLFYGKKDLYFIFRCDLDKPVRMTEGDALNLKWVYEELENINTIVESIK